MKRRLQNFDTIEKRRGDNDPRLLDNNDFYFYVKSGENYADVIQCRTQRMGMRPCLTDIRRELTYTEDDPVYFQNDQNELVQVKGAERLPRDYNDDICVVIPNYMCTICEDRFIDMSIHRLNGHLHLCKERHGKEGELKIMIPDESIDKYAYCKFANNKNNTWVIG
jgi:hypothetical protein